VIFSRGQSLFCAREIFLDEVDLFFNPDHSRDLSPESVTRVISNELRRGLVGLITPSIFGNTFFKAAIKPTAFFL